MTLARVALPKTHITWNCLGLAQMRNRRSGRLSVWLRTRDNNFETNGTHPVKINLELRYMHVHVHVHVHVHKRMSRERVPITKRIWSLLAGGACEGELPSASAPRRLEPHAECFHGAEHRRRHEVLHLVRVGVRDGVRAGPATLTLTLAIVNGMAWHAGHATVHP